MNCALFARTTRFIKLTTMGAAYLQHCKDILNALHQANAQITGNQIELAGTLRVSLSGAFAENTIAPLLFKFANQHPDLVLNLDFNSRRTDFIEEDIDFAIRYGQINNPNLIARKLIDHQLTVVASPTYLRKHGEPLHPKELKHHFCLVTTHNRWRFSEQQRKIDIRVKTRLSSNHANSIVLACEQHLGIAYMPIRNFKAAIEAKRVKQILSRFITEPSTSWIVYRNRRFLPARARLAIDFLRDHFNH